jgi:hypothetical protein
MLRQQSASLRAVCLTNGETMKPDAAKFAVLMGVFAAAILVAIWLLFALIEWDFKVTAMDVRALLVISCAAAVVCFVIAKIQNI